MPPAHSLPFALRAVDGGRAHQPDTVVRITAARDAGIETRPLVHAVRDVLTAASSCITADSGSASGSSRASLAGDPAQGSAQLHCPAGALALTPDGSAVRTDHLRTYRPCLRATLSELDLLLISDAQRGAAADDDIVSPATFEYALRHARRLARDQVRVLVADDEAASGQQTRNTPTLDAIAGAYPDIDVALYPVNEALRALASGRPLAEVAIASHDTARVVRSVALGLSGDDSLATSTVLVPGEDAIFFRTDTAAATSLEALLLGAAQLLMHKGEMEDGAALGNAVLKALEDGAHTSAITLLNPYSRCLAPGQFAESVIERLGGRPTRLAPVFPEQAIATPSRPQLRLVTGS